MDLSFFVLRITLENKMRKPIIEKILFVFKARYKSLVPKILQC